MGGAGMMLTYLDWIRELDNAMAAGAANLEETRVLGW